MIHVEHTQIREALSRWRPEFITARENVNNLVTDCQVDNNEVSLQLRLGLAAEQYRSRITELITEYLSDHFDALTKIEIKIDWLIKPHVVQRNLTVRDNIRNVIAVASAKGGVGKSTVALNMALAMASEGARVGLLDADIYGPSQPKMLGIDEKITSEDGKTMNPLQVKGLQLISVGFLVDPDKPIIWRGPMASGCLQQLYTDCAWEDLDYLVIDMPPGTGDIQLTLAQKIPVTGAIVVTTPAQVATLDSRKSIRMFEKLAIPVLGVVENMSEFVCPSCGAVAYAQGHGGGQALAQETGVDFLQGIPLHIQIQQDCDAGTPDILDHPESAINQRFFALARKVMVEIAARPLDYTRKFGRISIETKKPE